VESPGERYTTFLYLTVVHLQQSALVFVVSPREDETFVVLFPDNGAKMLSLIIFLGLYQGNPEVTISTTSDCIYDLYNQRGLSQGPKGSKTQNIFNNNIQKVIFLIRTCLFL
jgi:hypothetical protein